MKTITNLILLGFLMSMPAIASTQVGNGGDVIVCPRADGSSSVELYDFYEGEQRHGFKIKFDGGQGTLDEKLELVLSKIGRLNRVRAELYRGWAKTFQQEAEFISNVRLIDIPDTGDGYIPVGCELRQVAVQREPHFPGDKRYTIDLDLFDKMEVDQQVGLLLHEFLYREADHEKVN